MNSYSGALWLLVLSVLNFALSQQEKDSVKDQIAYNLKLTTSEFYKIKLDYYAQIYANGHSVSDDTSKNDNFTSTTQNVAKNWNKVNYIEYPDNFSSHCIKGDGSNSMLFVGDWGNNYLRVNSRKMSSRNRYTVVSTVYGYLSYIKEINGTNYTIRYDKFESVGISYNSTKLKEVKVLDSFNLTRYAPKAAGIDYYLKCFTADYIHMFNEMISMCYYHDYSTKRYEVYLNRVTKNVSYLINKIGLSYYYASKGSVTISYIGNENFEILMFVPSDYRKYFYQVIINRHALINKSVYVLQETISNIWRIGHNLYVFQIGSTLASTLVYSKRFPGTVLNFNSMKQFSSGDIINWYSSNEQAQIIIETMKNPWVSNGRALYSVVTWTYNELSDTMSQTRSILVIYGSMTYRSRTQDVTSIIAPETKIYLGTYDVDLYSGNSKIASYTWSRYAVLDGYSGFGARILSNGSFDIGGRYHMSKDYSTNQYVILGQKSKLYWNSSYYNCSVYTQGMTQPHVLIKNELEGSDFYRYLNLTIGIGKPNISLNIEFLSALDLVKQEYSIWEGSFLKVLKHSIDGARKIIDLDLLVKGSFIVRKLPFYVPISVDYVDASASILAQLDKHALFKMQSFKFADINNLFIDKVESMFGLVATSVTKRPKIVIILKKKGDVKTYMYEKSTDGAIYRGTVDIYEPITRVFPLYDNFFFIILADGSFYLFNSIMETWNQMPYPGINCLDVAWNYHPKFKSSIICLNKNLKLAVYLIDKLAEKSITDSLAPVADPDLKGLYIGCKLITSDAYESKVFIYCPGDKKVKPALYLYYLEVEEYYEFVFLKEINLSYNNSKSLLSLSVYNLEIVNENIIVHYKGESLGDFYGFYTLKTDLDLKLIKFVELPGDLRVTSNQLLQIYKHRISTSYLNKPGLLVVPTQLTTSNQYNALVIDPNSPQIETFTAFILPRHSKNSDFFIFPTIAATVTKYKLYSIGILHYKQSNTLDDEKSNKLMYRIQLIEAASPHVVLDSKSSEVGYREIFNYQNKGRDDEYHIEFESHLGLIQSRPSTLTKTFRLHQGISKADSQANDQESQSLLIEYKEKLPNFNKSGSVEVFRKKFSEIAKSTVINWEFNEESIFDWVEGSIIVKKPLEFEMEKEIINFKNLDSMHYICIHYSKKNSVEKCTRGGIALQYNDEIAVLHTDNIDKLSSIDATKIPFDSEQCNKMMIAFNRINNLCTIDLKRSFVSTDIDSLYQKVSSNTRASNFGRNTDSQVVSINNVNFIRMTQDLVDDKNRKGTGYTNYLAYSEYNSLTNSIYKPSSIGFQNLCAMEGQFSDIEMYTLYNHSNQTYYLKSYALAAGNLQNLLLNYFCTCKVYVYTYSYTSFYPPYISYTYSYLKSETHTESRRLYFSSEDILEVKEVLFDNAYLSHLTLDGRDNYPSGEHLNETYADFLMYLPNYHSMYLRFNTTEHVLHPCTAVVHMLFNPFSGLRNINKRRPVCYKWACVMLMKFPTDDFAMLYDLKYEEVRNMSSNFNESFQANIDCNKASFTDVFMIHMIPDKYRIKPTHVLNLTDVEYIAFDKKYQSDYGDNRLRLLVFHSSKKLTTYLVNRDLVVNLSTPLIVSKFLEVKMTAPYLVKSKVNLNISHYVSSWRSSIWIYIGSVFLCSIMYSIYNYRRLKKDSMVTASDILKSEEMVNLEVGDSDNFSSMRNDDDAEDFKVTT